MHEPKQPSSSRLPYSIFKVLVSHIRQTPIALDTFFAMEKRSTIKWLYLCECEKHKRNPEIRDEDSS